MEQLNPNAIPDFIKGFDPPNRFEWFMIIDTVVWNAIRRGEILDAGCFNFHPHTMEFAEYLVNFLRKLNFEDIMRYFRFLDANRTYQGLIIDGDHARAILAEYEDANDGKARQIRQHTLEKEEWDPDFVDDDLKAVLDDPANASKPFVQRLFEAMVDFDDVKDQPKKKPAPRPPRNKQARAEWDANPPVHDPNATEDNTQVKRVKEAPNAVLEAMAWVLFQAIVDAQLGHTHTSPWGGHTGKNLYEAYPTLDSRVQMAIDALADYKAVTDNLMTTPMLRRLAATPSLMGSRKTSNEINAQREASGSGSGSGSPAGSGFDSPSGSGYGSGSGSGYGNGQGSVGGGDADFEMNDAEFDEIIDNWGDDD
ncbi:hypothetical protein GE09DRAFT_1225180 [Coniochaeta sp. 2T2.1]|nr:hypothetical protein GE09DRAFT_1225180 [Coniochaeta sp. 2T2.1]